MISSNQSTNSAKIIQQELVQMSLDPAPNITAGPKGGNLYEWVASIIGPASTPYADGVFFLDINFPMDYPQNPPKLTFRTRIYHCNINSFGDIAMDIDHTMGIRKILILVYSLLANANPAKSLVPSIAYQYSNDRTEHDKIAAEWTQRYAN